LRVDDPRAGDWLPSRTAKSYSDGDKDNPNLVMIGSAILTGSYLLRVVALIVLNLGIDTYESIIRMEK